MACKEWNQLPAAGGGVRTLSGDSYDNTRQLDGIHWRHVKFVEQFSADRQDGRWLMMSDVCKHCVNAGCLEVCPTGAIIRTEFDSVFIQQDVCNGCRACIPACPFGVVDLGRDGKAHKCTLCYDRLQHGMEPACAQACPTDSIRFGEVSELMALADQRVVDLRAEGVPAYVYGKEEIVGGLNCFFLLVDRPEVYGLPAAPKLPSDSVPEGLALSALTAAVVAVGSVVAFRKERMDGLGGGEPDPEGSPKGGPYAGGGTPPGTDLVAFMSAVHGANETARARDAEPPPEGGCGGACGCHA